LASVTTERAVQIVYRVSQFALGIYSVLFLATLDLCVKLFT